MPLATRLTQALGLSLPILQAPMAGGGDTAELVAAVSNAGGLGFVGAAYLTPEQILERGRSVRSLTSKPFGINLFAPLPKPVQDTAAIDVAMQKIAPYYEELGLPAPSIPQLPHMRFEDQLDAALQCGAAVFSFAFGRIPREAAAKAKSSGLLLVGTATTVNEAKQLVEENAVDAIVAQGGEAGGHRSTFQGDFTAALIGTMSLVPQTVDAVQVPVIASGGIMDGRGICAALMLGASAVQMGTAFLTTEEAGVSAAYKDAIFQATEEQTRITRAFSGRPARGIANRFLRDYEQAEPATLPFPLQNALTRPLRTEASKQNRAEYLSLWAGQGLRMARRMSAAALVLQLEKEMQACLQAVVNGQ